MYSKYFILLTALCLFAACGDSGKEGMLTTDLGTRYTYTETNDDGQLAEPGDYIYFHAQLRNERDSIVGDTRDREGDLPSMQVLPDSMINEQTSPVEDVARNLRVGERAVIRINIAEYPPQYKPPGMQNDSILLYDIEVAEVVDQDEFSTRQAALRAEAEAEAAVVKEREPEVMAFTDEVYQDYKDGELEDIQEAGNGLRYIIHEEGSGPEAEPGKGVVVQYIGRLTSNGEVFDQSFERGMGLPFVLGSGGVIPGWEQGIDLLQEGDRATIIIPAELGYGAQGAGNGSIPPNSELMFYVELEEVQE